MNLLVIVFRFFLKLRYKVKITGLEIIKKENTHFVIPNHQAIVDPLILFTFIRKHTKVVPVVLEKYFSVPLVGSVLRKFNAVPVVDISVSNREVASIDKIFERVFVSFKEGKNVLLYPSGQLTGQGYEKILNKKSAHQITLNLSDDVKIIAVRIRGLWGSMWSRAWIGRTPDFFPTLLKGVFYVFANILFLLPRRNVTIEFIDVTEEAKNKAKEGRIEFNNYLESVYNVHGEEAVLFLKHYFFLPASKRKLPERIIGSVKDITSTGSDKQHEISDEVFQKVKKIILEETELTNDQVWVESNINLDLNIDSITLVTIISRIEDQFSVISQTEITDLKIVYDLCVIATGVGEFVEKLKPSNLSKHIAPIIRVSVNKNETIPMLFLNTFRKYPTESFVYDKMLGSTGRKEFLLKAYVVAQLLKKEVKGKYVGIMLPALQSTNLLVMATYLAGKIPVMFNWTVGKKVLEHCFETSGAEVILTAKTFHDKVSDLLSDKVKNHCVFFEQKVRELTIFTKLSGVLNKSLNSKPKIKLDDTAVVLFTSGSESLPKAVHLTHRNIVADMWGVFENININTDKIFLAFLPPFHSFGFTVLTVLPSITGVKVAYTPDPTDSREVLKILKHTKANTILGTPTFLKMLLSVSVHKDFSNVELAISGAESLHPDIMRNFYEKASPKAKLLEGYGITECAPVLTINPLEKQKEKSVGTFIKGLEYLITDINDFSILETGKEGMIMVRGENVFKGYVDKEISSPFVNIGGKEYYKTGDLGYVDDEGYLFITGRLKRFIKVAGEMISLPAIESTLLKKYGSNDVVTLAVEGNDTIQPPQTVVFSTFKADLGELNSYLKESGFSSLVKINKIIQVEEIPLLGTGKTDYKVLREMIN